MGSYPKQIYQEEIFENAINSNEFNHVGLSILNKKDKWLNEEDKTSIESAYQKFLGLSSGNNFPNLMIKHHEVDDFEEIKQILSTRDLILIRTYPREDLSKRTKNLLGRTNIFKVKFWTNSKKETPKQFAKTELDQTIIPKVTAHYLINNKGKIIYRTFEDISGLDNAILAYRKSNKASRYLVWILIVVISLLSIFGIWKFVQNKSLQRKAQSNKLKLQAVKSQLNPHFVYNTMTSIQTLIDQGKSSEAKEYLVTLSKIMRSSMNSTDINWSTLQNEINFIKQYIKLEQLRTPFFFRIEHGSDSK